MNHNIAAFEAKQLDPRAIPLMLDIDGNLSETSAHNFFLVVDGKLCTPTDRNVLGGITKAVIFDLAEGDAQVRPDARVVLLRRRDKGRQRLDPARNDQEVDRLAVAAEKTS